MIGHHDSHHQSPPSKPGFGIGDLVGLGIFGGLNGHTGFLSKLSINYSSYLSWTYLTNFSLPAPKNWGVEIIWATQTIKKISTTCFYSYFEYYLDLLKKKINSKLYKNLPRISPFCRYFFYCCSANVIIYFFVWNVCDQLRNYLCSDSLYSLFQLYTYVIRTEKTQFSAYRTQIIIRTM